MAGGPVFAPPCISAKLLNRSIITYDIVLSEFDVDTKNVAFTCHDASALAPYELKCATGGRFGVLRSLFSRGKSVLCSWNLFVVPLPLAIGHVTT